MYNEKIPLIEVKGLKKYYPIRDGIITHTIGNVYAIDGVDLTIHQGETLGLVGESGCGKSTLGRQIVSLEKPTDGQIIYDGQVLNTISNKQMKKIRTEIQMVFQDPYSSLNPRKRIYDILSYPMLYHGICTRQTVKREVERLLDMVGLPKNSMDRYPHEFSGGQRQRIGIARALSLKPKLIVCDEPVSALDVSIQAQILNLLRNLQKELNLTYLFIGHGLDAVNYISNRIAVMYLGKIVEIADAKELFSNPIHPYTKALCNAAPIPDPEERDRKRTIIQGEIPSNTKAHDGCRFYSRCPYATDSCKKAEPMLLPIMEGSSHLAACPVMTTFLMGKENTDV
ncbi:MAG: appF2 [Anaerocolumna sp.]|jgi:oligopeptide/dipeptide ABC transporter ATP-binding protein|nr:appF2 [Anaerocolumna sp.]